MTLLEQVARAKPPRTGSHEKIVKEFETLARVHHAEGPVLEIMHGPRPQAISMAPFWADQERHVLVRGPSNVIKNVQFHRGDPNDMTALFDDECFSTVIWNRCLERDQAFWLTLGEIRRVLRPSGVLMICTKGFAKANKSGVKIRGANGNDVPFLTATGAIASSAPDYWRFSPQGLRRVVFDGFDVREIRLALMVPHLFAAGVKRV